MLCSSGVTLLSRPPCADPLDTPAPALPTFSVQPSQHMAQWHLLPKPCLARLLRPSWSTGWTCVSAPLIQTQLCKGLLSGLIHSSPLPGWEPSGIQSLNPTRPSGAEGSGCRLGLPHEHGRGQRAGQTRGQHSESGPGLQKGTRQLGAGAPEPRGGLGGDRSLRTASQAQASGQAGPAVSTASLQYGPWSGWV